MRQPNVLLIADRGEFAQLTMSRWNVERVVPAFTVMSSEVYQGATGTGCDLILIGQIEPKQLPALAAALSKETQPVIFVHPETLETGQLLERGASTLILRQGEDWIEQLIQLASECLRRVEMTGRAERAEAAVAELSAHATLGRYMLDMRHSLNNALTAVLGNAELLLMEPGAHSESVREQLATIRSMALRMNEIVARFSSLEVELGFATREKKGEVVPFVRSNAAGYSSF